MKSFVEGNIVVECGALLGYSTLQMAQTAAHVYSIDKHEGYGPSTLSAFLSNIEGHRDRITPIVGDAVAILPTTWAPRYFLDLDGTYKTTMEALKAIPRWGALVAVHDFHRNNCSGVSFAIQAAGYRVYKLVDTLALCHFVGK